VMRPLPKTGSNFLFGLKIRATHSPARNDQMILTFGEIPEKIEDIKQEVVYAHEHGSHWVQSYERSMPPTVGLLVDETPHE
jgi:hypothetical protein